MKARMLCLLLLSACTGPEIQYDYELIWTCQSPEGCERVEELALFDRLNTSDDFFFFHARRDMSFWESAQRVAADSLPPGCELLYGLVLFGHELEPSKVCGAAGGYEMELSIPNAITATSSKWLVAARDLGPW